MSPKLDFSKGISPCSCQNIELFTMWVFQAAQCGKDCFLILWIEKNTFQTKKVKFPKRPKNRVFQRGKSMFLSKNQGCYHVVFLGREGKKDRFLIFRIEKDTFQIRKGKFQRVPKIGFLKRGQTMLLSKYRAFYHVGFLGKLMQKRLFFNIVNRKEYFLEQKSEVSKRSKISNFSKGLVLFFGPKIKLFTMRVFRQTMEEEIDF